MNALRVIRAARGISQGDLAKQAKLRRETVSRAETGFARPTPDTAQRIAKVLGVSTEELFPPVATDPMEMVRWLAATPAVKQDLEQAIETLAHLQQLLESVLTYVDSRPLKTGPG